MTKLRLPTAGTVISEIKELIAKEGVQVFETNGRIQLYSGPQRWIAAILRTLDNNHERAFAQSWDRAAEATMIDVTPAGRRLEKYDGDQNIYDYFQSIYVDDPKKAYYHADKVMRFASREFAKACYGRVETAVCGADIHNVFFEVELPELIRNKRVETINDIPMSRIRDIYNTQGAYVAFREICKAETDMLQKREASACGTEIKEDRKDRLKFFRKAIKATFAKIKARDKNTMDHLGPIRPHVVVDKPIRFMAPKAPYVAASVQYG